MITESEDWDVFYRFGAALQEQALRKWGASSGSYLDEWRNELPEAEFDVLIVFITDAMRQNCGSFVDAVASNKVHRDELKRALHRFGCPSAASLVDDAIHLSERFNSNGPLPELLREKETIEEAEDISYEKLVDHIRMHYDEYSIDIRPMIEPAD